MASKLLLYSVLSLMILSATRPGLEAYAITPYVRYRTEKVCIAIPDSSWLL